MRLHQTAEHRDREQHQYDLLPRLRLLRQPHRRQGRTAPTVTGAVQLDEHFSGEHDQSAEVHSLHHDVLRLQGADQCRQRDVRQRLLLGGAERAYEKAV